MINIQETGAFVFLACGCALVSVLSQNLPGCDTNSSPEYYTCNENGSQRNCRTYAILHSNSQYSSLTNLSSFFSISSFELAEANSFSPDTGTGFISNDQPLLIPLECKCNSLVFQAEVRRISIKGESFYGISESLEGLTTCKAIVDKNPNVPPKNLEERINLLVPLKCACPSSDVISKFLLSYPVKEGDTLVGLTLQFNVTVESLVSVNNKYSRTGFEQAKLLDPFSTLLIPVQNKPVFGILPKAEEPKSGHPSESIRVKESHKRRKRKMLKIGVYTAIGVIGILASVAICVAFFFFLLKKKKQDLVKNGDTELHHLSLSIRTTSDKKVSFEGSQYNFDDPSGDTTTPHKMPVENYSFDELQKATEDFSVSNLIEGSVYHGRLKGKNLAIKRVPSDIMSKIDYLLFHERVHRHPNLIRFMGTCLTEGPDAFVLFEYAKNGSLKDWIHGGLAIKSHFIASCDCFLNWAQRLKICLEVATSMQYMHHVVNPSYVHRNIRSRNVFLDEEFHAKLGNFGMAKCVAYKLNGKEFHPGKPASWNKGYLAPEFTKNGEFATSADVFAYGVVLLEVLSGKSPIIQDDENGEGSYVKLSDEIKQILKSENVEEFKEWVDSALGDNYSFDGAVSLANLARSCVEDDPSLRPNAGEIVEKLLILVEEQPEGDRSVVCESSSKPLVKAVAKNHPL